MEDKLETLKDLSLGNFDDDCKSPVPGWAQDMIRDAAKEQITKLCKDMNLDAGKIKPGTINESGIFMFEYGSSATKHSLMTISTVAWIKYFFNLE